MTQPTNIYKTGDGRSINLEEITNLYRDVVSSSTPTSGRIFKLGKDYYSLSCHFKAIDCDNLEAIKTSKSYSIVTSNISDRQIESVRCISNPHLVAELAVVTSNNGRFLARLKGSKDSDNKRQFLELWDRSRLLKTINIDELDNHGLINIDETMSSMSWCPFGEQDKLLYVCQAKLPKSQGFFKQQVKEGKSGNVEESFLKREDWGEGMKGIGHTIAAIIDANDFKIKTFDCQGYSLANSTWLDEGRKIVSTAFEEGPRKLGLKHYNTRPSKLIIHETDDGTATDITAGSNCLHSLRASKCGRKILYLKNPPFGPHARYVDMNIYDLSTKTSVELAKDIHVELPERCFSSNDKYVLFVSTGCLDDDMCMLNIETKEISKVKFPTPCVSIFDFDHDIILASGSGIDTTPTLYVATLNCPDLVCWHQIEDCIHMDEVSYQLHKIDTSDEKSFVSAILVSPNLQTLYRKYRLDDSGKQESELPTMVIVHGGPHSRYSAQYMFNLILRARLGIKSLLINYRGSLGVDESYVESLCGKIGIMDVGDCLHIIRHFVKNKSIDPNKLIIQGGSHGGFLAGHLSCQEQFRFTCAIMRNPVLDLVGSFPTTDTPDWIACEGLAVENFDHSWYPSKADLMDLYDRSPMSHVHKCNIPTLMELGCDDQRVKMFQGERWVENLRARGVETKCKIYPDGHALSKPENSAESEITCITWALQHL